MALNFKLKSWEAETEFIVATIWKSDHEPPFNWEIYSKLDHDTITGGVCSTLEEAKRRCVTAAVTVEDAESW